MWEAAATALGSGLGFLGTKSANEASAKSVKRSLAFQREMAKNAHQYEVADLKAAGLNPILSAGGSGARASGGAQYQAQNVFEGASEKFSNTAKNFKEKYIRDKAKLDVDAAAETIENIKSSTALNNARAAVAGKEEIGKHLENLLKEYGLQKGEFHSKKYDIFNTLTDYAKSIWTNAKDVFSRESLLKSKKSFKQYEKEMRKKGIKKPSIKVWLDERR